MKFRIVAVLALLLTAIGVVGAQDDMMTTTFTVTIENVSGQIGFDNTGVVTTQIDGTEGGPAFPESGYEFTVNAEPGDALHFATMFVQSNDLFFAPDETGIALYDADGNPVSGDVTDQVLLWDAGTEVNEEPGVGENQAPRQAGPDTGETEIAPVQDIAAVDDGFTYPATSDAISVTVTAGDMGDFTVSITNVSGDSDLPSPITPVVWVVTDQQAPLFTAGEFDRGQGLEGIAEDGNPATLATVLAGIDEQLVGPISPGVFTVTTESAPLFTVGEADRGEGLEGIAEDGSPAGYADRDGFVIFNTPIDADEPGPAFPGSGYSFTFDAEPGDALHFATMYVQSNDLFFAPNVDGIALFDADGEPIEGNVTRFVPLWDGGTEVNEEPGIGENQAPRQSGPNTGDDEMGTVELIQNVDDGFIYPPAASVIRVTITVGEGM